MKKILYLLVRLFAGFILYGLGIVVMVNAQIGLSPWDVFHQGLSIKTGITMGQASIMTGLVIVILDAILGEGVGWGTVLNMIFIGVFLDIIKAMNIVPIADNLFMGIIMMLIGIIISAIATVLYLGAGLGSGPRDGLMLAFNKKTSKPVGVIRTCIELTVLVCGWILGGSVGLGTVISAFGLGYAIQTGFKICKVDSKSIKHRVIMDDIKYIKGLIEDRKNIQPQEQCVTEECRNKN
ncbi:YczE/YyaS/YitT family protein [Intestinibacter sp.]